MLVVVWAWVDANTSLDGKSFHKDGRYYQCLMARLLCLSLGLNFGGVSISLFEISVFERLSIADNVDVSFVPPYCVCHGTVKFHLERHSSLENTWNGTKFVLKIFTHDNQGDGSRTRSSMYSKDEETVK